MEEDVPSAVTTLVNSIKKLPLMTWSMGYLQLPMRLKKEEYFAKGQLNHPSSITCFAMKFFKKTWSD